MFKVSDELPEFAIPSKLPGEADFAAYEARTGYNVPINPMRVVFPIVSYDSSERIQLIGTGFFITTNGLFVTARHVLLDALDQKGRQKYPIALFQFLDDNVYIPRPIVSCVYHSIADVTVGVAASVKWQGSPLKNPILGLTLVPPNINARVATYAYPKHKNVLGEDGRQILALAPTFYDGDLVAYFPKGRDSVLLPGPCYQTSITVHGGASGGPVFDQNGEVFGINSTGIMGADISFVSNIKEIFDLAVDGVSIDGGPPRRTLVRDIAHARHIVVKPPI